MPPHATTLPRVAKMVYNPTSSVSPTSTARVRALLRLQPRGLLHPRRPSPAVNRAALLGSVSRIRLTTPPSLPIEAGYLSEVLDALTTAGRAASLSGLSQIGAGGLPNEDNIFIPTPTLTPSHPRGTSHSPNYRRGLENNCAAPFSQIGV